MVFSIVTCCRVSKKTLPGRYAGGSGVEEKFIYIVVGITPHAVKDSLESGVDGGVGGVLLDELAQLPRLCPAGWQQQHPHL